MFRISHKLLWFLQTSYQHFSTVKNHKNVGDSNFWYQLLKLKEEMYTMEKESYHMINIITSLGAPIRVSSNDKVVSYVTCQSIEITEIKIDLK